MDREQAAEILEAASDRILDAERWTTAGSARAADNLTVSPISPHAVSWCAWGAIAKEINLRFPNACFPVLRERVMAAAGIYATDLMIANDTQGQLAAVRMLREASARALQQSLVEEPAPVPVG